MVSVHISVCVYTWHLSSILLSVSCDLSCDLLCVQVLDDEAEMFVVKLWRLLIYETEAKHLGIGKSY